MTNQRIKIACPEVTPLNKGVYGVMLISLGFTREQLTYQTSLESAYDLGIEIHQDFKKRASGVDHCLEFEAIRELAYLAKLGGSFKNTSTFGRTEIQSDGKVYLIVCTETESYHVRNYRYFVERTINQLFARTSNLTLLA